MEYKVSVITPSFNSERYIGKTIESVREQTYDNWEMIVVDDCSTDKTCDIVRQYMKNDVRIKLLVQEENEGAGAARTRAMFESSGRFIAYLDADDIWKPEKLKKQVAFMIDKECGFCCTSYEVIDDNGSKKGKEVHMLPRVDYRGFLANNLLQTVGIMVDTDKVNKNLLVMPNIRRRQDAATWLKILKSGFDCYGIDEILAEYRRTVGSLSSNRIKSAEGVWNLYRNIEQLSFPMSCYCFFRYAILAIWKRVYFHTM